MYYVYFLQSIKDPSRFYTGYTTDLKTRVKYHNEKANKFSRVFAPWKVVWYCAFSDIQKAKENEKAVSVADWESVSKKHQKDWVLFCLDLLARERVLFAPKGETQVCMP